MRTSIDLDQQVHCALGEISLIGCRIVVSGGHTISDIGVSSKPVTDIADGISSPARCSASIAPAAMSSLAQASAVTSSLLAKQLLGRLDARLEREIAGRGPWLVVDPGVAKGIEEAVVAKRRRIGGRTDP